MTCAVTGRWTPPATDFYPEGDFTLWSLTDDSLARVRRQHLRAAADLARDGDLVRGRREWFMAREVHDHQLQRFRLRMRYGAVDDHVGTTTYDCYVRHDEPPSYALAKAMDATNASLGRRHVLTWGAAA